MSFYYVCHLDDLEDLSSQGFTQSINEQIYDFFLIRKNNRIFGYKNSCPHLGASLNWQADIFLNRDKNKIQCGMHGAQFAIETGECIFGPCINQQLEKVNITVTNTGEIYIYIPGKYT